MSQVRDTGPMGSKKFLSLMAGMILNKAIIIMGLLVLKDNVEAGSFSMWSWMTVFVIVSGFFEVGGVLGIAYVDRYVRVAQVLARQDLPTEREAEERAGVPKAPAKAPQTAPEGSETLAG